MFSKEDYEKYFDQIARVERKMIYGAYDLAQEISNVAIIRILSKIGDDEVRHYGYVLKMIRATLDEARSENRREVREYYVGTVLMRDLQEEKPKDVKAYCVNLSKTGICLEGTRDLLPGGFWDLEIRPLGKGNTISRRGKVVWSKKVEPDLCISGMIFSL